MIDRISKELDESTIRLVESLDKEFNVEQVFYQVKRLQRTFENLYFRGWEAGFPKGVDAQAMFKHNTDKRADLEKQIGHFLKDMQKQAQQANRTKNAADYARALFLIRRHLELMYKRGLIRSTQITKPMKERN